MGIPQLCIQDSALGVRETDNITAFPAGITVGATWDKTLMYQRGIAMGEEFRGKGANVYLGTLSLNHFVSLYLWEFGLTCGH